MAYWLLKSEPDTYSIDNLAQETGPAMWEGCRNYTVRNFFRDNFAPGDLGLFHHSNAQPSGIAGVLRVVSVAYPDPTQFDPASGYHDPKSILTNPRWLCVDVEFVERFSRTINLADLRAVPELAGMAVLQKGQRLSVMPVSEAEWNAVLALR